MIHRQCKIFNRIKHLANIRILIKNQYTIIKKLKNQRILGKCRANY
ncbi:hypothetical protein [Caudoviricetes sp.]|nr:hypothetical protein [Caudoviricetes sp.]